MLRHNKKEKFLMTKYKNNAIEIIKTNCTKRKFRNDDLMYLFKNPTMKEIINNNKIRLKNGEFLI